MALFTNSTLYLDQKAFALQTETVNTPPCAAASTFYEFESHAYHKHTLILLVVMV